MNISHALQQIEQAGFSLLVDGPDIVVNPPGKLSLEQRQFIRDHKPEIIAALLDSAPAGHDHQAANDHQAGPFVTINMLPGRLIDAATRVCRELWNDTDEAVQAMLEDLTWHDPKDWIDLIQHFQSQLPPKAIPPLVTCSGCNHAAPSPHHPAIIHCHVGVESGAATGGWFDTDSHLCAKRQITT